MATPENSGMKGSAAVEVEGLMRRFGDFTAVNDISFSVDAGELFGFLGPNGAGKTTTISILCTLLRPSGGRARVAGYDVSTERDRVRSNIGLVFQEITLDDYLTAAENLRFHAVMYGVPNNEIEPRMTPLLEMVGLTERKDQLVQQFSGGMKRRLEIARGLLHTPRVLFLDEPTIGLDPQTRLHIWDYVDELRQREKTTMFLTTHYMDEAERCDRIAIIDGGKIVAIDTPDRLKASVGADTVTLSTADDEQAAAQISERLHVQAAREPEQLVIKIADGEEFVPKIFAAIDVRVRSVNVRRPTLDDVFIKYTGHDMRDTERQGSLAAANPVARAFRSR
ncbi:MAG TPA: ATP-binding cassette domain-containing protein [Acidimicrobiia bacterium]|nr:ATP-binding cassette domain-containing protein [Acidimicrobiia bacterium]